MRVYHFVNRKFGLDDLNHRRLKIALIDDLNDPFELLCADLSNADIRRVINATKDKLAKKYGLLCFSKGWQNPVQWSHYAEKHRGLCLAFDVPDNTMTNVKYKARRLSELAMQLKEKQPDLQTMKQLLSTKYHHWRYEQEVRGFLELKEIDKATDFYFAEFSENLRLSGVIVGAQSTITRGELMKAIGTNYRELEIFKARLAFQSFRVVRQQNELLWT